MTDSVMAEVRRLLTDAGVKFVEKEHPPTHTSEESANTPKNMRTGGAENVSFNE
jgi:hypothetical protein